MRQSKISGVLVEFEGEPDCAAVHNVWIGGSAGRASVLAVVSR